MKSNLPLVVDLQNCIKAQQNENYAEKVKISNLQKIAKTIAYIQEQEYHSREELQNAYDEINRKIESTKNALKSSREALKDINEQLHFTGQYFANKTLFSQMIKSKNQQKFKEQHQLEIECYETARKYLREKCHP